MIKKERMTKRGLKKSKCREILKKGFIFLKK